MAMSLGEFSALAALFQEHRARLLSMLQRRNDPSRATRVGPADVLNASFLIAQRGWATRPPEVSPYAWLYGIARDCLIEAWRRETRGPRDLRRDEPWPERTSAQLGLGLVDRG